MGKMTDRIRARISWLRQMEISIHASHACYFMALSVFPGLMLILGLIRYTGLEPGDLMELLAGVIPSALEPHAWQLIAGAYAHTSKAVISLSALAALWSAGRGIYGLLSGLNAVYGVEEHRGWLKTRLMSMFYTFLFLLVLLLTLALHVFGSTLLRLLRSSARVMPIWLELIDLRFMLLVVAQTLLFSAMFMYLPGRKNGFRESLPGALLGSLGWMGASTLFSVYVEHFSRYTNVYGSVYAVALAMLWLYVCVSILFYGGALNRYLKHDENV